MVTIISGTNRKSSKTFIVAESCAKIYSELGAETKLFSLTELPQDFAFSYLSDPKPSEFVHLMDKYIRPAERLVLVLPEYQGTFPGIFKLFLDAVHPEEVGDKKVALVGVATGRAGNLRGLDDITNALHYLNMHVYPNKLPVSRVGELLRNQQLADEGTLQALRKQAIGFLKY